MLAFFKKTWAYIVLIAGVVGFVIWYVRSGRAIQKDAIAQVAAERQLHEEEVARLAQEDNAIAIAVKDKTQEIAAMKRDAVISKFHAMYGEKT